MRPADPARMLSAKAAPLRGRYPFRSNIVSGSHELIGVFKESRQSSTWPQCQPRGKLDGRVQADRCADRRHRRGSRPLQGEAAVPPATFRWKGVPCPSHRSARTGPVSDPHRQPVVDVNSPSFAQARRFGPAGRPHASALAHAAVERDPDIRLRSRALSTQAPRTQLLLHRADRVDVHLRRPLPCSSPPAASTCRCGRRSYGPCKRRG